MSKNMTDPKSGPQASIARTSVAGCEAAVADLVDQLGNEPGGSLTFFVSPRYEFERVAKSLHGAFGGTPSIGCTTAGELCSANGHCEDGIVATITRSPDFAVEPVLIRQASGFNSARAREEIMPIVAGKGPVSFAMLLVDGLSMAEEQVCGVLATVLDETPLVGGSAGDELSFKRTLVAVNGESAEDAAALALVRTTLPFRVFHAHHFEATDTRLVITRAAPAERRVYEINGEPAAVGYANAIGVHVEDLGPDVYAENPVMLSIGGEYYVRSIQKANDDGSLTFYCAVDEGLVLRIGSGRGLTRRLESQIVDLSSELSNVELVFAFDCILRRLQILSSGVRDEVRSLIGRLPVAGFSTYGEQYNGLHVNQTMTGVAIGEAA